MLPVFLTVAIALAGYGTLIVAVMRKTLRVAGSKENGFFLKTVLMMSTLTGFVVMCIFVGINQIPNISLIQVFALSFVCCVMCPLIDCFWLLDMTKVVMRELAMLWMIASVLASLRRPEREKNKEPEMESR